MNLIALSRSRMAPEEALLVGASGYRMIESRPERILTITYLGWYVVVKMPRVLGIVDEGAQDNDEYGANELHERMYVP